jgi:hypothetical protein
VTLRLAGVVILHCALLAACVGGRGDTAAPITDPGEWRRGLAPAGVDTGVPVAVSGGTRVPCDTAPHEPTRYVEVRNGDVQVEVPDTWEVRRSWMSGLAFRVPALTDSLRRAQADVSVITAYRPAVPDFARLTDTLQAGLATKARGPVLVDTMPDAGHRYTWWSWDRNGTTFSVFDGYGGAADTLAVRALFIIPLLKDRPRAAYEALSRDTGHLLSTLTVDGRRVFPGWALHPVVECYAAAAAAP